MTGYSQPEGCSTFSTSHVLPALKYPSAQSQAKMDSDPASLADRAPSFQLEAQREMRAENVVEAMVCAVSVFTLRHNASADSLPFFCTALRDQSVHISSPFRDVQISPQEAPSTSRLRSAAEILQIGKLIGSSQAWRYCRKKSRGACLLRFLSALAPGLKAWLTPSTIVQFSQQQIIIVTGGTGCGKTTQ